MATRLNQVRASGSSSGQPGNNVLGSILRRMLAGGVDLTLGAMLCVLLVRVGAMPLTGWDQASEGLPLWETIAARFAQAPASALGIVIMLWLPVMVVHLLPAIFNLRTPGAAIMGLDLVDRDGDRADNLARVLRAAGYILWPLTLFFAPFMVFISREQRGLHDMIAGVWVVRVRGKR